MYSIRFQTGLLNMTMSALKWSLQSPYLKPIENPLDVVEQEIYILGVQPANLQQLCDAIISIWTKISEDCFKHLVDFMPFQ